MESTAMPPDRGRQGLASTVTVATLASLAAYAVTLVQQIAYARRLGVGPDTDALAAALGWAVVTSGFVGTTMSSVLVPRYVRLAAADPESARRVFRGGATIGFAIGLAATLATIGLAESLAEMLLPGSSESVRRHLAMLLRVTSPLHVVWVAVWLAIAAANSLERFVFAALSPIVAALPVVWALLSRPDPTVDDVAWAYTLGAGLQVAALAARLGSRAAALVPSGATQALRGLAAPVAWIGLSFATYGASTVVLRMLASVGKAGNVAAVDYGLRLAGVAEQVLLAGLLAVTLTRWSRPAEPADPEGADTVHVVRTALGAIIGSAAILALLAPEVVGTLFGSTRFGSASVDEVATFIRWMAPGLGAHMILMVAIRGLLARRASAPILASALATVVATVAVGLAGARSGVAGVGAAYTAGWLAGSVVAMLALAPGRSELSALLREGLRSVGAALAAVGAALVLLSAIDQDGLRLVLGSLVAGLVLLASGMVLRVGFVAEMGRIALGRGLR